MNWKEIANRVAAHVDLPGVVLALMLLFSAFVAWRAQRRSDFDFGRMLLDENGKESAIRLGVLGSFAVSSWVLMAASVKPTGCDPQLYGLYLITWSGALVFAKAAEKWNGVLPWSKP